MNLEELEWVDSMIHRQYTLGQIRAGQDRKIHELKQGLKTQTAKHQEEIAAYEENLQRARVLHEDAESKLAEQRRIVARQADDLSSYRSRLSVIAGQRDAALEKSTQHQSVIRDWVDKTRELENQKSFLKTQLEAQEAVSARRIRELEESLGEMARLVEGMSDALNREKDEVQRLMDVLAELATEHARRSGDGR